MHIIVVDDDALVLRCVCRLVERGGYHVIACTTLAAVLTELSDPEIRLVILDLNLGNNEGRTLIRQIEARPTPLPLIILSGLIDPTRDTELRRHPHFEKPVGAGVLLHAVREQLSAR